MTPLSCFSSTTMTPNKFLPKRSSNISVVSEFKRSVRTKEPLSSTRLRAPVSYLAGPEDLKHEGQAVRDQLLGVLLFLDAAELLQETLDQRSAVLAETRSQRLQPSV